MRPPEQIPESLHKVPKLGRIDCADGENWYTGRPVNAQKIFVLAQAVCSGFRKVDLDFFSKFLRRNPLGGRLSEHTTFSVDSPEWPTILRLSSVVEKQPLAQYGGRKPLSRNRFRRPLLGSLTGRGGRIFCCRFGKDAPFDRRSTTRTKMSSLLLSCLPITSRFFQPMNAG